MLSKKVEATPNHSRYLTTHLKFELTNFKSQKMP